MKRTTPLTRHIGGKVREYRLKNGWTQTELAARMQVVGCDLSRETILAISSVVRGLPKRIIYFSSSVQSRASRMVVHFSYLSSLLLSEYAWLLVASCTAR